MKITTKIPASTANLGPGFDTLAVALKMYNKVVVESADRQQTLNDAFMEEIVEAFYKKAKRAKRQKFQYKITGDVPQSRGLGSSVTVIFGILFGLNGLADHPFNKEQILDLGVEIEGHPDNAVASFLGGFTCSNWKNHVRVPVANKLSFVAAIPSYELQTAKARAVLPKKIIRADVVKNLQHTSVITAAFLQKKYEFLKNSFIDRMHQPYRAKLIPGFDRVIHAAEQNGALGAYLSGAGSSLMAITLHSEQKIATAMKKEFQRAGDADVEVKVLKADNAGVAVRENR